MSVESLPAEICNTILQRRFNNPSIQYLKSEIKPISDVAEGYAGEHLNLFITYKIDDTESTAQFFIKRKATKNKVQMEAAEETGIYKREIFLYDYFLKELEKYNYDTSFASRSYYCIPDTALILENLKVSGYTLLERNTEFSMQRIKSVLKSLAMFHAAGYAYEQTKCKELNRNFSLEEEFHQNLKEIFHVQFTDPDAYCMKFWNSAYATVNALIDYLPKDDSYKQQFKKMFNDYKFGRIFVEKTNIKKTIGHGDLWSNNMMFKTHENGEIECKLLDFQMVRYFYPTFDIVLAVYCNTNKQFRDNHLNELLEYYYKTLSHFLTKYSYDINDFLSREDLHKSFVSVRVDALLQVVYATILICFPKEKLNEAVQEAVLDGSAMEDLFFGNVEQSVEYFKNDETFKRVVTEVLLELFDAIIAKEKN